MNHVHEGGIDQGNRSWARLGVLFLLWLDPQNLLVAQQAPNSIVRINAPALLRAAAGARNVKDGAIADFGWAASVRALTLHKFSIATLCGIEIEALRASSLQAVSALELIYQQQPTLAARRLQQANPIPKACDSKLSPAQSAGAFLVALISAQPTVYPHDTVDIRQLLDLSQQPISRVLKSSVFQALDPPLRAATAVLLSRHGSAGTSTEFTHDMTQVLAECAQAFTSERSSTIERWLSKVCMGELQKVPSLPKNIALTILENSMPMSKEWRPAPGSELSVGRLMSVTGTAENLTSNCNMDYYPFYIRPQAWNGPITHRLDNRFQGTVTGAAALNVPSPGVNAGGTSFEALAVGSDARDTPRVPIAAYGVRHRTWGHSGSVRFDVRINYVPSPGALALGVRFKSVRYSSLAKCEDQRVEISCVRGCGRESIGEPSTAWQIFPISDPQQIDLRLSFNSCRSMVTGCTTTEMIPKMYEEALETTEIGRRELAMFAPVALSTLVGVNGDRVENGLLTYISSMVRESEAGGWLAPQAAYVERAILLSNVRFDVLKRLSLQSENEIAPYLRPEMLDSDSEAYRNAPWRERQAALKMLLPYMKRKVESSYRDALAAAIASAFTSFTELKEANRHLSIAVSQLGNMALADLKKLVELSSLRVRKQPNPTSSPASREALEAAVVGASKLISEAATNVTTEQRLRCDLWAGFDWGHLPDDDLKRAVIEMCSPFHVLPSQLKAR